jgi:hypothetical protein
VASLSLSCLLQHLHSKLYYLNLRHIEPNHGIPSVNGLNEVPQRLHYSLLLEGLWTGQIYADISGDDSSFYSEAGPHYIMSSSRTKKVHYEQGTKGNKPHGNRSRDSGVGSCSASDRVSLGTAPDSPSPYEDQRNSLGALQEALDAANERIRQLEAAYAKLNDALSESNKANRQLKREKVELRNQVDNLLDDLEDEKRANRVAREGDPRSSRERSPSGISTQSNDRDGRRSGNMPVPREDRSQGSSAKPIDLAVISQPTRFFQIGRVFKTLWTEPAGETATDTDKEYYRPVGYGQLSFTKMRRFVVLRKRLHCCLCLAISTYGGQGSAKKDSRSEDHAVVYSSTDPLPQDDQFIKEPIPIIIEESTESIDSKSVIDFGRVYTVEHNVKVMNVGRLRKADKKRLDEYFTDSIGISVDLEDEGYGVDTPSSQSDTPTQRSRSSRISSTPNPMANPFMPRIAMSSYVSGAVTYPTGPVTYAPPTVTYAPLPPNSYGHFPHPRPPEGPSKFAPNDGHYDPYPL